MSTVSCFGSINNAISRGIDYIRQHKPFNKSNANVGLVNPQEGHPAEERSRHRIRSQGSLHFRNFLRINRLASQTSDGTARSRHTESISSGKKTANIIQESKGEMLGELNALLKEWSEGAISDRGSKQKLIDYFKNAATELSNAWPKGAKGDSLGFVLVAERYQAEKEALFECAGAAGKDREDKLQTALECANLLHAKERHNENVACVAQKFLELVFDSKGANSSIPEEMKSSILDAAKWHGLSDRDIPVRILTAKRRLSDEEKADYINPRSKNSAAIYREYGFTNKNVVELIEKTRVFGDESKQRPLAAQFLDLIDRISAMGVKPSRYTQLPSDSAQDGS